MCSDIFMIVSYEILTETARWYCRVNVFYGFLDHGIYSSKIAVCYLQTMHKMEFFSYRPGQ